MQPKIMLDMDGVVANFVDGICQVHNLPNPYLDGKNPGVYGIEKLWGMDEGWFYAPVGMKFFMGLKAYADGMRLWAALESLKYDVQFISSPPNLPGCEEGKRRWLKQYCGSYHAKHVIFEREKFKVAKPDLILIDDHDETLQKWRMQGGQAVLFPRPWNSGHDISDPLDFVARCLRAKGFKELEIGS